MDSSVVADDLSVATGVTVLETDESTPFDPMVRYLVLDQLVENISSDLQSEDVRGLTCPTSSGPVKSVEQKKRKASATDFASAHFKLKTKKMTKYVYMKEEVITYLWCFRVLSFLSSFFVDPPVFQSHSTRALLRRMLLKKKRLNQPPSKWQCERLLRNPWRLQPYLWR